MKINQHIHGALIVDNTHPEWEGLQLWSHDLIIAHVVDDQHNQKKANAELLAASYSAFDKAGREMGVDATELAKTLDVAAVIRAAREVIAELDHDTLGAGTSARVLKLNGLLNRLPL